MNPRLKHFTANTAYANNYVMNERLTRALEICETSGWDGLEDIRDLLRRYVATTSIESDESEDFCLEVLEVSEDLFAALVRELRTDKLFELLNWVSEESWSLYAIAACYIDRPPAEQRRFVRWLLAEYFGPGREDRHMNDTDTGLNKVLNDAVPQFATDVVVEAVRQGTDTGFPSDWGGVAYEAIVSDRHAGAHEKLLDLLRAGRARDPDLGYLARLEARR